MDVSFFRKKCPARRGRRRNGHLPHPPRGFRTQKTLPAAAGERFFIIADGTLPVGQGSVLFSFSILPGTGLQFHGQAFFKQGLVNIAAGADEHGVVRPGALTLQNRGQGQCGSALHGQLAVQAAQLDGLHEIFLGDGDDLIHILFNIGIEIFLAGLAENRVRQSGAVIQRDQLAGLAGGVIHGGSLRHDAHDLHRGLELLDGIGNAGDETAGGGEVLASEAFIADQATDFTPILSKFKGLDIDCLNLFANYKSVASILKQAKSLGIDVPIVTEGASVRSELFELTSGETEGVLSNSVFPMGTDTQAWHDFEEEYQTRRGAANNLHSYLYYETTLCLAAAVNNAGSADHAAVRDALASISWHSGLTDSDLSFNAQGDVIRPHYFGHIEGDELVFDAKYQANYESFPIRRVKKTQSVNTRSFGGSLAGSMGAPWLPLYDAAAVQAELLRCSRR